MHFPLLRHAIPLFLASLLLPGCSPDAKKARHQERADKYFAAGRYPEAEVEYLNVLRLEPQNAHSLGRLGSIYLDNGRVPRAAPLLIKARELDPGNVEWHVKAGLLNLAGGNFRDARELAISALRQWPTNEIAPLLLAQSVRSSNDLHQARQHIDDALRNIGETAPLHVAAGALLLREARFRGAETAFKRALALDAKSSAAHHALGALYWLQGDRTNAASELRAAFELAPARAPQRLHYADFLGKTGQRDEARRILGEMTRQTPDYLPAWISLAELALNANQLDECASLLQQALARDTQYFDALLLNGRLKLAQGQTDQAISELERLNHLYTRSPHGHYFLALASLQKGDTAKALRAINTAVSIEPDFDDAVLLQAQINMRRDNPDAAVGHLVELVKRRPNLLSAHLLLSAAYAAKGDFSQALVVARRMSERFAGSPEAHLVLGTLLQRQGKAADARAAYGEALKIAPIHFSALEQLVELEIASKRIADIQNRMKELAAQHPAAPEPLYFLGKIHMAQNEPVLAEQVLTKAIELNPDFQPAYILISRAYVKSGRHVQALEKLEALLAKNPQDQITLLQMGMIQAEAGHHSAARDAYEKLLALNPWSSVALNNLAYLYSEHLGQLEKAYDSARRARELLPNDPAAADTLGWILYKRGEYTWAISLLQESAAKLSNEPEVLFHLGMAYYMTGSETPARSALQRAVQTGSDFPGRAEALKRLSILDLPLNGTDDLAQLEKLAAADPEDPILLSRLAARYHQAGALEQAFNLYERALQRNPKNAYAAVTLAQLHVGRDNQKAMEFAKRARALAPEDGAIAHTLGRIAYASGDHPWSLSLLQQSEQRLPGEPQVAFDLAHAYFSVGRVTDAVSRMNHLTTVHPGFAKIEEARSFVRFANAFLAPEKSPLSLAEIESLLTRDPAHLPALAAKSRMHEHQGELRLAIESFSRILLRYPSFAPADKHLALLYGQSSDTYQKAYEHGTRARRAFPDDPEVAKTLGILCYRRGEHRRAIQLLKESAANRARDGETLFYLGLAHKELKENTEAASALREALTLNLNSTLAEQANRFLSQLK